MPSQRDRMLTGQPYRPDDPDLVAARRSCQHLIGLFNAGGADDERSRKVLRQLLRSFGDGSQILPRFQCDYGTQITVGAQCFVNYDAIFLDCASITIGDNVSIGPRAQLVTAFHPVDDYDARRAAWESAAPIVIGDNVWLAAGVVVCPGVTIGDDAVIRAGRVGTTEGPAGVMA